MKMTHEKEIKGLIELGEKARDVTWRYSERLRAITSPLERFEPVIANVVSLPEYEDNGKFIEKAANSRDAIKAMYEENQLLKKRIAELEKSDEWQPIETIEWTDFLDDTLVLCGESIAPLYLSDTVLLSDGENVFYGKAEKLRESVLRGVTHWRPLPTPPEENE